MRTTVSVADELLEAAKRHASDRGQTLGQFVEAAVRRELAVGDLSAERPPIPIFRGGTGVRPGVDLSSNRAIHELLDETLALDQRR